MKPRHIALIYSDNDPFIPQNEFARIQKELGPEVLRISGGGHFMDREEFPEIFEYSVRTYSH